MESNQAVPGETVGSFKLTRTELVGKNKTWIVECLCGDERRFWKYPAILNQNTCGCGTDKEGNTKEQRRMLNSRLHSYKSGAVKRGFNFELSYEEFNDLTQQDCTYCGLEPQELNYFENAHSLQKDSPGRDWSKYTIKFSGVDRVDSSLGYSPDNCVPCCKYCNRAKSDMSFEEFKEHINRAYTYLNKGTKL